MTEYILAPWLGMSGDAIVAGYAGSGGVSEITAAGACCGFSCAWIVFGTHSTEQSRSTNQPKCFMVRYDTANVSMAKRRPSAVFATEGLRVALRFRTRLSPPGQPGSAWRQRLLLPAAPRSSLVPAARTPLRIAP